MCRPLPASDAFTPKLHQETVQWRAVSLAPIPYPVNWPVGWRFSRMMGEGLRRIWLCGFGRRFRGRHLFGFGYVDPLPVVHGEEHIVAEAVPPMNAASFQVVEDFRRARKPHIHIAPAEMHGAVFDRRVVRDQANFRQWRDKIGFETHDLERVRCDPGAPFKGDRVGGAGFPDPITPIRTGLIVPL